MADEETNWKAQLSEEMGAVKTFDKFQNVDALARAYRSLEQHQTASTKIPAPDPKWNEAEWAAHFDRLGRPPSPADYDLGEFTPPEGLPVETILQHAHRRGLTGDQARGIIEDIAGIETNRNAGRGEAAKQTAAVTEQELRQEWGGAYDFKMRAADTALRETIGDQTGTLWNTELADGTLLGQRPEFVKAMAALGEPMMEARVHGEKEGGSSFETTITPADAKEWLETNSARVFQAKTRKARRDGEFDGADAELLETNTRMLAAQGGDGGDRQHFSSD